ncbi:hypothetical protein [Methanoculleus horonobensis]|jgi:hypothetical protein|uniref:hypothetical protein n=1 Tax=Methanoculleus horonobensis TaxID=528314 RepID=UPI00083503C0|nr:hypothetical protein [Methanoculleus horonobensis]MDD3069953.1 hypothetical protein [Methanoculleus horonobensis]MDD4251953.1 hypothetical protein [Methanoculleus horonobensis]
MAYEYGPLSRPFGETLAALEEGLMREYRLEFLPVHRRSARRSRRLRRIRGWCRATGSLAEQAARVAESTLPRIEQETGHAFRGPDGLARVLMAASTKRLFSEILAGFPEDALPIRANDLAMLANFADDYHALALIGDVTLRLKVLSGKDAGAAGLAVLSDRWNLYESRIGSGLRRTPDNEELQQEKETLARAVLGLIYVEGGVDALRAVVPLLTCGRDG